MAQVKRGAGESVIPLFGYPTLHFGTPPRRQGDRITERIAALHESACGTFGPHAMSELGPECAPKRTSAIDGFTPWPVAPVAVRHAHAARYGTRFVIQA
jgi:hypothetical protein